MKAVAQNYSGAQKQAARQAVLTPGKTYENVAVLPGPKCKSIINALEHGNFTSKTRVTVIERYAGTLEQIKRRFKKFPFMKVNFSLGLIEKTPSYGPYDLLDLDTCSSLSPDLLDWLHKQDFLDDGEVNLWLTAYRRRQQFRDSLFASYLESAAGLQVMHEIQNNFVRGCECIQAVTSSAIYSALSRYSCCPMRPVTYSEHIGVMYVYRYTNLRRLVTPRLSHVDIIKPTDDDTVNWLSTGDYKGLAGCSLTVLILKAIDGAPSVKAYATRQLRNHIKNGVIVGKSEKMIKAGWKSYFGRIATDCDLRSKVYRFISAV